MTSIIKTRYRDIPWSEAKKCVPRGQLRGAKRWFDEVRGQPVEIQAPPCSDQHVRASYCKGPFYRVVGVNVCVCPHIAEIGD